MKRYLLCLLLCCPAWCYGQTVKMPAEVKIGVGRMASVTVEHDGEEVRWTQPEEMDVFREYDPDPRKIRLRMIGYTAGRYRVYAVCSGKTGKLSDFAVCTVIVGEPGPVPPIPVPVPPVPPVPPIPPVPPPSPSPIPAAGLRVLIIEETKDRGKLTPGQFAAIFNQPFRDLLSAKCVKDAENPNGAFRIWDKDINAIADSKLWQDAMKRPRTMLPWIIISNPAKGGYEGPLPTRLEDTISLLNSYIGPEKPKGGK